jgi:alpha-ketoglutarate-dependent taurine dioxygenase
MKSTMPESTQALPLLVTANGEPLAEWHAGHRDWMEARLLEHGAVLFRGFAIRTQELFQRAVAVLGGNTLSYVDGNSPREKLGGGVYTSTEYPAEYFISLHNELSYSKRWPSRVFFCCITAPAEGGETPLADSRAILRRLPEGVRDEFVQKQVRYIRNLHGGHGLGPSWQKTFETDDRAAVEEFCRATDSEFQWNEDGSLTVTQVRPAIAVHPRTGETVWFNQADQFHPSTHPPAVYESLMAFYDGREEAMPQTAAFGDGTPMDRALLDEVRRAASEEMRTFPWQEGDLLMVDNMLVAHGRKPFKGPRKILVSMT